jgi:hypothetical protein
MDCYLGQEGSATCSTPRCSAVTTPSLLRVVSRPSRVLCGGRADYGRAANTPVALACCLPRLRAEALLGLGFGDRFEALRGGSALLKEGVLYLEKPAELQGKPFTRRLSPIT